MFFIITSTAGFTFNHCLHEHSFSKYFKPGRFWLERKCNVRYSSKVLIAASRNLIAHVDCHLWMSALLEELVKVTSILACVLKALNFRFNSVSPYILNNNILFIFYTLILAARDARRKCTDAYVALLIWPSLSSKRSQ